MKNQPNTNPRKFGLSVGGAFAGLGLISWNRGHDVAPYVLEVLGVLLIAPGAVAPSMLEPVERAWMPAAGAVGQFNTQVILGVFLNVVPMMRDLHAAGVDYRLENDNHWNALGHRAVADFLRQLCDTVLRDRCRGQGGPVARAGDRPARATA